MAHNGHTVGTILSNQSEANNRGGHQFSLTEEPFGPWLCQSEKVSVFYARQKPTLWPEHYHRQAELFLTFDGACAEITSWWGKSGRIKKQSVGANQLCLIPPNLPHKCEWKNEADVVAIYIEETLLKEYANSTFRTVVVEDFKVLSKLDACLWSMGGMFRDLCRTTAIQSASFIEGIGTALASRTLEQHFRVGRRVTTQPRLSGNALRQMLEYIDAHIRDTITVPDLARHAALGVDRFAKLLKSATGMSPRQFLLKYRVGKALELLRTGEFRVAEAAYEVGFYDQSHLSWHCQKFFGFSPRSAVITALISDSSSKKPETSKILAAALG